MGRMGTFEAGDGISSSEMTRVAKEVGDLLDVFHSVFTLPFGRMHYANPPSSVQGPAQAWSILQG